MGGARVVVGGIKDLTMTRRVAWGLPRAYVNQQRVNLYDSPRSLGGVCSTQGEFDGLSINPTKEKMFGKPTRYHNNMECDVSECTLYYIGKTHGLIHTWIHDL